MAQKSVVLPASLSKNRFSFNMTLSSSKFRDGFLQGPVCGLVEANSFQRFLLAWTSTLVFVRFSPNLELVALDQP